MDKVLYFDPAETALMKKNITGLSHSVEGIKVALAGVAITAQLVKVDLSLMKIDEKGLTIGGIQKSTWPWAKEGSWLWKKVQKDVDAELRKLQQKAEQKRFLEKELPDRLKTLDQGVADRKTEVGKLTERARKAEGRLDKLEKRPQRTKERMSPSAGQRVDVNQLKGLREAAIQINDLHSRIDKLVRAL
ncbi:hypothetical protein [Streptomyces sp. URMC 123]|uniref:hypothetical protein n=1 Tax=Streptomyces sp. URMC 123 TaxID=3423403 RepID=UPI003F1CA9F3